MKHEPSDSSGFSLTIDKSENIDLMLHLIIPQVIVQYIILGAFILPMKCHQKLIGV